MPKSLWKGDITFGLVTIPVSIVTLEKKNELHFHLLDSRDKSRVHYMRVNEETGKEVPWTDIVKGYEFEKDNYIILQPEDFKKASPDAFKSIEIEEFVELKEIDNLYFDKPYYLIPEGKNKKAYVLLREALKKTNKVGVAKVVIRTKEYLSLILPHEHALVINLIRFQQEIRDESELNFPNDPIKSYKIKEQEIKMASDLIKQMTHPWKPEKYHDEYSEALMEWIETKLKGKKAKPKKEKAVAKNEDVIDFVSLLKQSLAKKEKASTKKTSSRK